jgi:aspartate racemase
MEQDFYRRRLTEPHGLDVVVPGPVERGEINRVIFEELVLGRIEHRSKARYVEIIDALVGAGAEGIIAGCTEIGMLVTQDDVSVPLFDTANIHALAAVEHALR